MERQLETYQKIERSIIKKFRKQLWTPFIVAVKRYELIQAGDKIAVCISGGKDSMLMAKLLQELQRHSEVPFELVYLVMDPGYNEINRQKIESNAALLHIPITVFETNIFDVANNSDKSPCYLCARMRRGHLYKKAQELGCNKIALGHHFNDVILHTRQYYLCFRITKSCIVFQYSWSLRCQHQSKEDNTLELSAFCCHCIYCCLINILPAELVYLCCIERTR